MLWIAPTEKDADNASLEKRIWDSADQFRALIEADWKMPDDELRMPNRILPSSKQIENGRTARIVKNLNSEPRN